MCEVPSWVSHDKKCVCIKCIEYKNKQRLTEILSVLEVLSDD